MKNNKPLTYGTDFVVSDGGGKLNLVPLKPLNPSSYYMIVATDSLKDSRGTPLKAGAITATSNRLLVQPCRSRPSTA